MERPAWRNNEQGMSLIEVLFSISLLALVALAILQTSLTALQHTTMNLMRDESVRVVEQTMSDLRYKTFTSTTTDPALTATALVSLPSVTRQFRGYMATYTVKKQITDLGLTTKQITVTTEWTYRSKTYSHSATIIIGRT